MTLSFDQGPGQPVNFPAWGDFVRLMLSDSAYNLMSSGVPNKLLISRVEDFFTARSGDWPVIKGLWDQAIATCPPSNLPTQADTERWTQHAQSTNMPFSFSPNGTLNLN